MYFDNTVYGSTERSGRSLDGATSSTVSHLLMASSEARKEGEVSPTYILLDLY